MTNLWDAFTNSTGRPIQPSTRESRTVTTSRSSTGLAQLGALSTRLDLDEPFRNNCLTPHAVNGLETFCAKNEGVGLIALLYCPGGGCLGDPQESERAWSGWLRWNP